VSVVVEERFSFVENYLYIHHYSLDYYHSINNIINSTRMNNATTASMPRSDPSKRRLLQNFVVVWLDGAIIESDKDFQQMLSQLLKRGSMEPPAKSAPSSCRNFLDFEIDYPM
jgi:hypothetical protein